jgi:hypothetical protein
MSKSNNKKNEQDLSKLTLHELLDQVESDFPELWKEYNGDSDEDLMELKSHCRQLILVLKYEHKGILQAFNEVLAHGIRTSNGMQAFNKAQAILLNHVEKEKVNITASLQNISPDSSIPLTSMSTLEELVSSTNNGMTDIMSDFVNFVDSYVEDNTVSMFDVHSEFIRITKMFIERFELEETVLFEMYESIICPHKK